MNTLDTTKAIQTALNGWDARAGLSPLVVDGNMGPLSQTALSKLTAASQVPPAAVWPYQVAADGGDIIITTPVFITTFGGNGDGTINDPQDNGRTASGLDTIRKPVFGVALAMDSRNWPDMQRLDRDGYQALLGAPFPRMPWGTPVEITIGGITYRPADGLQELGPGRHASKPGQPHGCDLTIPAAKQIMPGWSNAMIAKNFEPIGTVRVIGMAHLLPPA